MSTKSVSIRIALKDAETVKAELKKLGYEGEKLSRQFDRATQAPSRGLLALNAAAGEARQGLEGLAGRAGPLGTSLRALGPGGLAAAAGLGAMVAAGVGITRMTRDALDFAGAIDDTANRIGIGVEALQGWRYGASQAGVATEIFDRAMAKLATTAGQAGAGAGEIARVYAALGIAVTDASGRMRSTEAIFEDVAEAIGRMPDQASRAAFASKLFGEEAGPRLAAALAGGRNAVRDWAEAARAAGAVIPADVIARADELGDRLDGLSQVIRAQLTAAFVDAGPALLQATQLLADALPGAIQATCAALGFVARNADLAVGALTALAAGKAIGGIGSLIGGVTRLGSALGGAAGAATVAMRSLTSVVGFFGGPIGAAVTGLSLAYAVLATRQSDAERAAESLAEAERALSRVHVDEGATVSDLIRKYGELEQAKRAQTQTDVEIARAAARQALRDANLAAVEGLGEGMHETIVDGRVSLRFDSSMFSTDMFDVIGQEAADRLADSIDRNVAKIRVNPYDTDALKGIRDELGGAIAQHGDQSAELLSPMLSAVTEQIEKIDTLRDQLGDLEPQVQALRIANDNTAQSFAISGQRFSDGEHALRRFGGAAGQANRVLAEVGRTLSETVGSEIVKVEQQIDALGRGGIIVLDQVRREQERAARVAELVRNQTKELADSEFGKSLNNQQMAMAQAAIRQEAERLVEAEARLKEAVPIVELQDAAAKSDILAAATLRGSEAVRRATTEIEAQKAGLTRGTDAFRAYVAAAERAALANNQLQAAEGLADLRQQLGSVGMAGPELAAFRQAQLGATESQQLVSRALTETVESLDRYKAALTSGKQAEIEAARVSITTSAEQAAAAERALAISEAKAKASLLVAEGVINVAEATAMVNDAVTAGNANADAVISDARAALDRLTEGVSGLGAAAGGAKSELQQINDLIAEFNGTAEISELTRVQHARDVVDNLLQSSKTQEQRYTEMVREAQQSLADLETHGAKVTADQRRQIEEHLRDQDPAVEKLKEQAQAFAEEVAQVSGSIADDLTEALFEAGDKGFSDLFENAKKWLQRIGLEILKQQVVLPVTMKLVGAAPGLFGIQGAAGVGVTGVAGAAPAPGVPGLAGFGQMLGGSGGIAGGAGGGLFGDLGKTLSGILDTPLFGFKKEAVGALSGGGVGSDAAAAAQLASAKTNAFSLGDAFGAGFQGLGVGTMIAGLLGGNQLVGGIGGAAGGLIGTAIGGPLGGLLGSALGGLVGGIFKKKPSVGPILNASFAKSGKLRSTQTDNGADPAEAQAMGESLSAALSGLLEGLGATGFKNGFGISKSKKGFRLRLPGMAWPGIQLTGDEARPLGMVLGRLGAGGPVLQDKGARKILAAADGGQEGLARSVRLATIFSGADTFKMKATEVEKAMRSLVKEFAEGAATIKKLHLSVAKFKGNFAKEFNEDVRRQILSIEDPAKLALEIEDRNAKARLDAAKKIGADLAQVEHLNALLRKEALEEAGQGLAKEAEGEARSLMAYLRRLTFGDLSAEATEGTAFGNGQAEVLNRAKALVDQTLAGLPGFAAGGVTPAGKVVRIHNDELLYTGPSARVFSAREAQGILSGGQGGGASDAALRRVEALLQKLIEAVVTVGDEGARMVAGAIGEFRGEARQKWAADRITAERRGEIARRSAA